MDELKPCPFCGEDAEAPGWFQLEYNICCPTEGCPGRSGASEYADSLSDEDCKKAKMAATNLWNTRTPDLAAEVLRLRAEVERLRKALEDIADGMGETSLSKIGRFAPAIARAALKAKGTE